MDSANPFLYVLRKNSCFRGNSRSTEGTRKRRLVCPTSRQNHRKGKRTYANGTLPKTSAQRCLSEEVSPPHIILFVQYFVEMVQSKDRSHFSSSGSSIGTSTDFDSSHQAFSASAVGQSEEDKDHLEQRIHARLGSIKDGSLYGLV